MRADSAFYSRSVLSTARKFGVRFSVTVRQDKKIRAAIAAIPESAWEPIPYWLSTPEVSGADVAETSYTCFAHTREAIEVRLIVRRVLPTPGSQLALFTDWDYHAMVTDRDGNLCEVEADHRRHAVVEQSIAELKSAGLAHLPSGRFMAINQLVDLRSESATGPTERMIARLGEQVSVIRSGPLCRASEWRHTGGPG